MFLSIYNLLMSYIFVGAETVPYIEISCGLFSTILCFCCVALPIVIVYWFAKFIMRGFY